MPLRIDSRQQARFQKVPVLPGLPEEPSLESAYTGAKANGLTRVFQLYDQARKGWSQKVALHLGRMQDAILAIGSGQAGSVSYPNRGWASLLRVGEQLVVNGSETLRPNSARIVLTPYWQLASTVVSAGAETSVSGSVPPSTAHVLAAVWVAVVRDSSEPEVNTANRGVLRVTLTPGRNSARGSTNQIRRVPVVYSYIEGSDETDLDWSQIHYFAPQTEADPGDTITWADMGLQGVYAELI